MRFAPFAILACCLAASAFAQSNASLAPVAHPALKPYSITTKITTTQTYANGMQSTISLEITHIRSSAGDLRTEMATEYGFPGVRVVGGKRHVSGNPDGVKSVSVNSAVDHQSYNWRVNRDGSIQGSVNLTHPRPYHRDEPFRAEDSGGCVEEVHTESLGTRSVQGVMARGNRSVSNYSAGCYGFNQPYVATAETWFSQERGDILESTVDDPRSGHVVTTLVSFSDQEPDAALFQPPAGAKIISDVPVEAAATTPETK